MSTPVKKFALIGAAGFIAQSHLEAIRDVGGELVAACDIHDSVQRLDFIFPDAEFFLNADDFFGRLSALTATGEGVDFVVVCSPDDCHMKHISAALACGCDVICEKPLVPSAADLDELSLLEGKSGHRVYGIQQLRCHRTMMQLKNRYSGAEGSKVKVEVVYVTHRGPWYEKSWRAQGSRGGGLVMDIGIHFIDAMLWVFGPLENSSVAELGPRRARGRIEMRKATVDWFLSISREDTAPFSPGATEIRRLRIDGRDCELTDEFRALHTNAYRDILSGSGIGIEQLRPTIELCERIQGG